jgi:hypothetical protein
MISGPLRLRCPPTANLQLKGLIEGKLGVCEPIATANLVNTSDPQGKFTLEFQIQREKVTQWF